ncbi:hypothetical protein LCGC14_3037260, partial [marine sediment metagenome]
ASSLLAATIVPADLTIQVKPGFGALFPAPSTPQVFYITLENDVGAIEVMKCTSRSVDLLTVVRGQDGTVAQDFVLDVTRVELRVQAIVLEEFVQVNGDAMTGDLDFATNEIQNAYLTGTTRITGGQSIGMAIRGTLDQSNNELVVPAASGVRATAGGVPLVVNTDDIIALLDTAGVIDLASATVGVKIGTAGASDYLRLYGGSTSHVQFAHNDTDLLITAVTTGKFSLADLDVEILSGSLTVVAGLVQLTDSLLIRPEIKDFALTKQTVSASTTTAIDYELGSFVQLDMDQDITDLSITNPPATGRVGSLRLKIKQDVTGGWLITNWPSGITWPGGIAPVLSTAANSVDYVDIWTDDE